MLEPSQVGHLVFRNTVSETLDALVAGQSNFAGDNPQSSPEERKKYEEREWEGAKDALKTYTRLLTTIYVGAQADEQYRGRLLRPDMSKVDIDLTRNPLRVLEEVNRSDLMKS